MSKKVKKILMAMLPLTAIASMPLVAMRCEKTKTPEEKKPEDKKPEDKKPEGKTTIENIINKHKEIKDDELNKTKSLLNELNKEIKKREGKKPNKEFDNLEKKVKQLELIDQTKILNQDAITKFIESYKEIIKQQELNDLVYKKLFDTIKQNNDLITQSNELLQKSPDNSQKIKQSYQEIITKSKPKEK